MRISDWSSDVCSSDLFDRQKVSAGTRKKIRLRKIVPSDTATSSRAVAKRSDCNASAPYTPTATIASSRLSAKLASWGRRWTIGRSEEHTSELQSLMRISYAVFCLKKKKQNTTPTHQLCTYIIDTN